MSEIESKRIYIRADANDIIATGHVMRCMSIAAQIKKQGVKVTFITADDNSKALIESRGYQVDVLGTQWDNLDSEIDTLCQYIKDNNVGILLVDTYYVTDKYFKALSELTKVIYIDDMRKFAYPVYTLINYAAFADVVTYEKLYAASTNEPEMLIGAQYIPLRDEFVGKNYVVQKEATRVLITTGGTDRLNVAGNLLESFMNDGILCKLEYHVIVGCFNCNKDMLCYVSNDSNGHVTLHENVDNMSYWMTYCDVALSASGSTLYELSACGVPTICFEVADNQAGADMWQQKGYMRYAGNAASDIDSCVTSCSKHLKELVSDYNERIRMSTEIRQLIDGKGAGRIAGYLINMLNDGGN
jgi:UDP-2,4-diacetamido-2,4,6-trideoxy-beta-L-altropyranose hydrolase